MFWDQPDLDAFGQGCSLPYNVSIQNMIGDNKPSKCSIPIIIAPDMCKEALLDVCTIKGVAGPIPLTNIYNSEYSILGWAKQVMDLPDSTMPLEMRLAGRAA